MRNRARLLSLLLVASLGVFVAAPMAYAHEWAYADSFPAQSYGNSTGTLNWSGNWVEIGELDGPTAGNVQVGASNCSGKCLVLDAPSPLPGDKGLKRSADLREASAAELYFTVKRQPGEFADGTLSVELIREGQRTLVKSYDLSVADGGQTPQTFDISSYIGSEVELRFLIRTQSADTKVSIDDVELGIEPIETTTSTTKPTTTTTTVKPSTTTAATVKPSTTTTRPSTTTTSTTVAEATTSTTIRESDAPVARLNPTGPSEPPSNESGRDTTLPPPTRAHEAAASGVAVNMTPAGNTEFVSPRGLSPLTSLTPGFRSVVEAIQSEFLSALGLASLVAFFALRLPAHEEEEVSRS